MKKILLAGPWIGEFGWELFCWQGYIRKQSQKYDRTIVVGRPGNAILYEDFCDKYIEFDPNGWKTDGWRCYDCIDNFDISTIEHTDYISGKLDLGYLSQDKNRFFNEQIFHKYKSDTLDKGFDILFHCRNKKTGDDRNWSFEQWKELVGLLSSTYRIACIGNLESFYIDNTEDLRGIGLKDLVSIMNRSRLIVGPSSGPMHLAALCGLRHLVWSTPYNYVRYTKDWNPWNTDILFYDKEGWNPNVTTVFKLITQSEGY